MRTSLLLAAAGVVALAEPVRGQTLPDWLNARVDEAVAARLEQRGSGRQTEAPSSAQGSTTLVDHASFADLVGLSANILPTVGDDTNGSDPRTTAVTLTPYAVVSALLGRDPDDPFHYERSELWRSVALTVGTEDPPDMSGLARAALVGLKVRIWNRQSVDPTSERVEALRTDLGAAGAVFGDLEALVQDSLFAWVGAQVELTRVEFINRLSNDPAALLLYLNLSGAERQDVLLQIIADQVDPFVRLRTAANAVVEELRSEPLLSVDVQSKLRNGAGDEVNVGLNLDAGLTRRLAITVNGGAAVVRRPGNTAWGGTVAGGLTFELGHDRMVGPDPLALDLAFEGLFIEAQDNTWRLQGKLTVPLMEGISLPVSVTWANRTELLEEEHTIGRVGLSVDTSRLLSALESQ